MGYPENVLATDEQVVLHRHPHWKRLIWPVLVLLLVTALAAFGLLGDAAEIAVLDDADLEAALDVALSYDEEILVEEARRLGLTALLPDLEKVLLASASLTGLVDRLLDSLDGLSWVVARQDGRRHARPKPRIPVPTAAPAAGQATTMAIAVAAARRTSSSLSFNNSAR